ncbi:MAG: biotin/lipoyl-binding protein, partial [Dehalococcoidales bacterium]
MGRKVAIIVLVLIIIAGGSWWLFRPASSKSSNEIVTSGFIEATEISAAPEAGGRLVAIYASEGDEVTAGMPLFQLDDSLLKAREQQAEASLDLAKAYLEQAIVVRDGARQAWEDTLEVQNNPLELEARISAAQGELDIAELDPEREQAI